MRRSTSPCAGSVVARRAGARPSMARERNSGGASTLAKAMRWYPIIASACVGALDEDLSRRASFEQRFEHRGVGRVGREAPRDEGIRVGREDDGARVGCICVSSSVFGGGCNCALTALGSR